MSRQFSTGSELPIPLSPSKVYQMGGPPGVCKREARHQNSTPPPVRPRRLHLLPTPDKTHPPTETQTAHRHRRPLPPLHTPIHTPKPTLPFPPPPTLSTTPLPLIAPPRPGRSGRRRRPVPRPAAPTPQRAPPRGGEDSSRWGGWPRRKRKKSKIGERKLGNKLFL